MKKLEEYKDEIYTCSRCGLCQSVCPIFNVTKKETTVSRGFFSTLMGVLLGHLSFSKKLRKNIDMCLTCNKCKEFCPSGIDAEKIITSAKIASFGYVPMWKKLLTRALYSRKFLQAAGMVRIYRFFPVLNFTFAGRVLHKFLMPTTKYKKQAAERENQLKTVIFSGCVNNYFNSSSLNALRMLLEKNGVTHTMPDFDCCAIPAYNIGDVESFAEIARKNLDKISDNTDFILFDCASCKKAFALYAEILQGEYKEKAEKVFAKCRHINEFLAEQKIFPAAAGKKAAYHKPCHTDCLEKTLETALHVGLEVDVLPDKCCGSAGLFFVENPKISAELSKKRAEDFVDVDCILTDCPLCRLGLIKGAVLQNSDVKIANFVEIFC